MENKIKLEVDNISHYYESKDGKLVHALDNINLSVKEGEFLAIVGSSGCGKSTLLNIMSGMIKPTEGNVMIDGETLNFNKHKIGYISQSDTLLPWRKILDNVAIGLEVEGVSKKDRYDMAKKLMETSGLSGFEDKYPYELSGGMRKRAIIIRALATDPEIIFMDEPFGPLDVFTKELLQSEILKIWSERKNTIIYITHDIAEAITLADRIILMSYRPSSIKSQYKIDLPRPRDIQDLKHNSQFIELEKHIWSDIKNEVLKAREEEMMSV
ncbi:ABC transporter ATP-binding protein [Gottschalkia acidurici 9a]|uniref:ABC transporter ATP-binding protein n=1 Tax=Gottschalkia acidurici (strain ATCC 7906 / DSM 604 / BCRC 14475 / CIP 104303 / KCTC 5404 / NCIMB 10678 / 9a) TaxID=1128398 RepID=K0AY50_GOTA9|nr:ABC transporter ATP-binding protein [Gottschalkia acidurici]AFS78164.1 ABC transporter ATP-binding protein [Gottschalkia acidurici 9a]